MAIKVCFCLILTGKLVVFYNKRIYKISYFY